MCTDDFQPLAVPCWAYFKFLALFFYFLIEKLTDQVMQNPQVLAALQERLDNVAHTPSSYIET